MNRREAVGLIEAIGLATAIEAADAAVKSANVRLIGYEACKGDGMSTIKVAGDIGAVKAAVDAATAACAKGRGVWATKVIARPSEGIEKLIYNNQTVGFTPPVEPEAEVVTKAVTIEENTKTAETAEENEETAEENEETAEENTEE
ncbi:BMC domain-containing protein [Acetobacterium carbinolicum]|uniref:BMC domain-containing protein n=1 Tax=Acetobacterium carbinolicum TaxID=52690 RepID=UPI0039C90722